MPLGKEVGLGTGHIVLDGDQWGPRWPQQPLSTFRPTSIVAKRSPISETAEFLSLMHCFSACIQADRAQRIMSIDQRPQFAIHLCILDAGVRRPCPGRWSLSVTAAHLRRKQISWLKSPGCTMKLLTAARLSATDEADETVIGPLHRQNCFAIV